MPGTRHSLVLREIFSPIRVHAGSDLGALKFRLTTGECGAAEEGE